MQSVLSIDEENEDEKIYRERLSKPPIVRINSQQALQNPLKLPMHNLRREVILISENITEKLDNTNSKKLECQEQQSDDADFSIIDTESNTSYVQYQPHWPISVLAESEILLIEWKSLNLNTKWKYLTKRNQEWVADISVDASS